MSTEGIVSFLGAIKRDPALFEKAVAATRGKEPEEVARTVSGLGQEHGFVFTPEEALQVRAAQLGLGEGELSEVDLQAVTGGAALLADSASEHFITSW